MAEKATPGDDGPTKGYSVDQINASIEKAFQQIYNTEWDIATMREKHLEPLTKARTRLWRQLKADTGLARNVLDIEYRKFKLYLEAADLENGEEIRDQMRIAHNAMHPGQQGDFIPFLRAGDEPVEEEAPAEAA